MSRPVPPLRRARALTGDSKPQRITVAALLRFRAPTQKNLAARVLTEGVVELHGKTARRTVEALARRGLVSYEAESWTGEFGGHYRFKVRRGPLATD